MHKISKVLLLPAATLSPALRAVNRPLRGENFAPAVLY
jgi:hypothetical protein